jgi:hypothetical protein
MIRRAMLAISAVCLGAACAFFGWYTVRLVWVNLMIHETAAHRQTGMYIGAVAFPVATILFGYGAWRCGLALARSKLK